MSLSAKEVIIMAIDAIYDGVKPITFSRLHEVDETLMMNRMRALARCEAISDFDNLMTLLSAFLSNGPMGQWEREACTDYCAELTKDLEANPFHLECNSVLDDTDERVADRDFFVNAAIAALMIPCTLESLYKQSQRGKVVATTVHGEIRAHYKHNDKWLMIPIAYVDKRREKKKKEKSEKCEKVVDISEKCVKMSTVVHSNCA